MAIDPDTGANNDVKIRIEDHIVVIAIGNIPFSVTYCESPQYLKVHYTLMLVVPCEDLSKGTR